MATVFSLMGQSPGRTSQAGNTAQQGPTASESPQGLPFGEILASGKMKVIAGSPGVGVAEGAPFGDETFAEPFTAVLTSATSVESETLDELTTQSGSTLPQDGETLPDSISLQLPLTSVAPTESLPVSSETGPGQVAVQPQNISAQPVATEGSAHSSATTVSSEEMLAAVVVGESTEEAVSKAAVEPETAENRVMSRAGENLAPVAHQTAPNPTNTDQRKALNGLVEDGGRNVPQTTLAEGKQWSNSTTQDSLPKDPRVHRSAVTDGGRGNEQLALAPEKHAKLSTAPEDSIGDPQISSRDWSASSGQPSVGLGGHENKPASELPLGVVEQTNKFANGSNGQTASAAAANRAMAMEATGPSLPRESVPVNHPQNSAAMESVNRSRADSVIAAAPASQQAYANVVQKRSDTGKGTVTRESSGTPSGMFATDSMPSQRVAANGASENRQNALQQAGITAQSANIASASASAGADNIQRSASGAKDLEFVSVNNDVETDNLFKNTLLSTSQGSASSAKALPQLTISQPVGQSPGWEQAMASRIVWMGTQGVQSANLTLNPQDLGAIQIQVDISGDQANVQFQAQSAETCDLIEKLMPRLSHALEGQGLKLEDSKVTQFTASQDFSSAQHTANQSAGRQGGEGTQQQSRPGAASSNLMGQEPSEELVQTLVNESSGGVDYYA
ncbi:flagellar hook-length control protein FliK [Spongiibacter nanhainus]|uniref:Flagellar hook-length control protein FliK n=1 Tax=Spongiibacter nanhainus TaxID=2794344 RepID=A0A7T4R3E1_9GAMM|nr:flagellar hook-length control protein FliK [Spongiibacter nanhainus]QQD19735.1 flagellar hook-length control protein FliK [Spongiibacter nanhainus]